MICNQCDGKIPEDSLFCPVCGGKIKERITPTVQEPVGDMVCNVKRSKQHPPVQKKNKARYCRLCGGMIDSDTKRCAGCNKQYFRGIRFNRFSATVSILLLVIAGSIGLITYQYICNTNLQGQIWEMDSKIEDLEALGTNLQEQIQELQSENEKLGRKMNAAQRLTELLQDKIAVLENASNNTGLPRSLFGDNFWNVANELRDNQ